MRKITISRQDCPTFLLRLVSSYRGGKLEIRAAGEIETLHQNCWGGGSRNSYSYFKQGKPCPLPAQSGTAFDTIQEVSVAIEHGDVLVEHCTFQGKDLGIRFYVHPKTFAGLAPDPVELSHLERKVLEITAGCKSAYRVRQAESEGIAPEQWQAGKAQLVERELLKPNGAITPAGRNAIA